MWPGPYGEWGSRKYLLASLDQSLRRMGLDYVDIFYSHRPDPETPVEETMSALDSAVRSGKALYAGISNYNPEQTARAVAALRRTGHAMPDPSDEVFDVRAHGRRGLVRALSGGRHRRHRILSPGARTTDGRYLDGVPEGSRASKLGTFLKRSDVTEARLAQVRALNEIARRRGQSWPNWRWRGCCGTA